MSDNKWISFSAVLNGQDVRLSVSIEDFEIVTRDNETSFDVEENAHKLVDIEFEEVY